MWRALLRLGQTRQPDCHRAACLATCPDPSNLGTATACPLNDLASMSSARANPADGNAS